LPIDKSHRAAQNDDRALWTIVGYLISGLLIWGGIGFGLDKWLGTHFLMILGMLAGLGASLYLIWLRFGK
jgi:ATP synthase protein I